MIDEIASQLADIDLRVQKDVPLAKFTTWKVGGPASLLIWVDTVDKFIKMLGILNKGKLSYFILGNGSNLLVSDEGVQGAVIRLIGSLAGINFYGNTMEAGGGALLGSVVTEAYHKSLGGMEFTFGIPGTVGGAVMINAGAFGRTISNVLSKVQTIDRDGEIKTYGRFGNPYRSALVPVEETVTFAWFALKNRDHNSIKLRMDEYREKRRRKQPWGMPTAGSVFKNPEGDYAGRLIEACGLKGRAIGSAKISETHGNFIINEGNATATDIRRLMDLVTSEVMSNFGIKLRPEVRFIGFESDRK